MKDNSDLFCEFVFFNLNDSIAQSTFPPLLKLTYITPVHKKDPKKSKDYYGPVSMLSNISKIYERFMKTFRQTSEYFDSFFEKF